jgi:hypothetical protein
MVDHFEFKVVGMTFLHELPHGASYPDDFVRLHELMEEAKLTYLGWTADGDRGGELQPYPVMLYRNPENEYDSNAIEVHAFQLGRKSMIGHVPRDVAAQMAPSMDDGDTWSARLETVLIDPEHEVLPGALIVADMVSATTTTNNTGRDK